MSGDVTQLTLALFAFVGTHFALSHPLRAPLVARLGTGAFQGVYSLVAFATMAWVAHAFREAPYGQTLWAVGDTLWAIATALMFLGAILFVGSLIGNPALPAPGASKAAAQPARGVFAITRHPMMWSFAIWSVVHVLVSPRVPVVILSGAIAFLALFGAAGQDVKKAKLMGASWRDWTTRTAFFPFAGQFAGRIGWAGAWPCTTAIVGGTLLWLAATWAHPVLGAPIAGLWRWLG